MLREYTLIEPEIIPRIGISEDDRVRILSCLIRHLSKIGSAVLPVGVKAEVIPVRFHHVGRPYPCIALYEDSDSDIKRNLLSDDPYRIEGHLEAFISKMGMKRLLELSTEETVSWKDILTNFNDEGGFVDLSGDP